MRRETKIVVTITRGGECYAVVFLGRLTLQRYATRAAALVHLKALRSGRRRPEYGSDGLLPAVEWRSRWVGDTRH